MSIILNREVHEVEFNIVHTVYVLIYSDMY
jgi:hypothetical protein